MNVLVYGANGFTGQLIVERAKETKHDVVLAGRNAASLAPLGERLGLEARAVGLDDAAALARALDGIDVVIHAAGPFIQTSKPMVDACLHTGTHYVDVTGEIAVFEAVLSRDDEAKRAGVVLMPGAGFDVVPTDCLAKALANALPDATHLELAFHGGSAPSKGTARTVVHMLGQGGKERVNGKIVDVAFAAHTREIPFPSKKRTCASVPWGDVSTAFWSTGIPNVRVYMSARKNLARAIRAAGQFAFVARAGLVKNALSSLVDARLPNPDEGSRARVRAEVWGEARSATKRATGALTCAEGYTFTAASVWAVVDELAKDHAPGAFTPASAFGADFVKKVQGTEVGPIVVE